MKILFVSEYFNAKGQGAYQLAHAHHRSFCALLGADNVDVVSIKTSKEEPEKGELLLSGYNSRIDKLINSLNGYPSFYSKKEEQTLLRVISEKQYDLIFFDNSYFGTTIQKIKKKWPTLPVWVFYHGVKTSSSRQVIRQNLLKPYYLLYALRNSQNERKSVKFGDLQILLNQRDSDELYKYYGRAADVLLPVYYRDTAKIYPVNKTDEFRILFIGGRFWPNILGMTWFAEKVMPYLRKEAKLFIIGHGMEYLRGKDTFQNRPNIEVVGGSDDLDFWYNSADIVVGPIFHGDGMKTKTAEALMYGKRYLGTKESMCGYIGLDKYYCETAEEFIHRINGYIENGVPRYDPAMRQLYESHYSVEASNKMVLNMLARL